MGEVEKNSQIFIIYNRYKNIFNNFIDSLNIKSLSMPNPINKNWGNITPGF